MRSEERSPFTPPAGRKAPVFLVAAALLAVGFAAYRWSDWRATEASIATAIATVPPTTAGAGREPQYAPAIRPRPEAASKPAWVRCEINGRVIYSDGACDGATQKSSATTTQAALSTIESVSNTPVSTTIYRCTAYSGLIFWSSTHCHQKKALVDRMVSVPRGLDFQQQIVIAERSIPREPAAVAAAPTLRTGPSPALKRQQECKYLDNLIRELDAWARQPQSAAEQDRVRGERKQARDRQFALRC